MRKETFEALMKRQLEIYERAVGKARQEVKPESDRMRLGEDILDLAEMAGRIGLKVASAYGGRKVFDDSPEGRKSMVERLCELKGVIGGADGREDSLMTKLVYKAFGIQDMAAVKATGKLRRDAAKALERAEPVLAKVEKYGRMMEKYADNRKIAIGEAVNNPTAELYAALNTFETEEEHEKFLADYEDVLKYTAVEVVLHDGSDVALRIDKDCFYFVLTLARANSLGDIFAGGDKKVEKRAQDIDSIYQDVLNVREATGAVEELVTKTIDHAMKEHRNTLQLRKEYPKESRIRLKELYA